MQCNGFEGPCSRQDATLNRQKTKYEDDKRNFDTLCPECQKLANKYWDDMFADYYSGLI